MKHLIRLPSHGRTTSLWLATLGLGTAFIFLYTLLSAKYHSMAGSSYFLLFLAFFSLFAALFSLPALMLLPFGIRWALNTGSQLQRHVRLLVVLSSLFGTTAFLVYWLINVFNPHWQAANFIWLAVPYLPAALLAAYVLYAKWLFPPRQQD